MRNKVLLKLDSKGKQREWYMEISDAGQFRSVSGLSSGKKTISEWTQAIGKNTGKSNETSSQQQALLEVSAKYKLKEKKGWSEILNTEFRFSPMLAHTLPHYDEAKLEKWEKKYSGQKKFIQPKFDGARCNVYSEKGAYSRANNKFNTLIHIESQLKDLHELYPNVIVDGEVYNHKYRDDLSKIMSLIKKDDPSEEELREAEEDLELHIYDFYDMDNPDLTFEERFNKFSPLIKGDNLVVVDTQEVLSSEINNMLQYYLDNEYEGGMLRLNLKYETKKCNSLWKVKPFFDDEFVLLSIDEGTGDWYGKAKTITFRLNDSDQIGGAGVAGDMEYCRNILTNADKYIGGQVTVKYYGFTPDGIPKFATAKMFHEGKRDY